MSLDQELDDPDRNYYYSILNLPPIASAYEIRERYRHLSIQFHPDKQLDEATRETASREFLKVQKAYQVLSDPFLRAVYDTLGEEGLQLKLPDDLRGKPMVEIKSQLKSMKRGFDVEHLENLVNSTTHVRIGIDARSLRGDPTPHASSVLHQAVHRVRNVAISSFGLCHSTQRDINEETRLQVTSLVSLGTVAAKTMGKGRAQMIGTIRHQYSPRLNFELTALLSSKPTMTFKTNYHDDNNYLSVETRVFPTLLRPLAILSPRCWVLYSRRLFPDSATEGVITLDTMFLPSLAITLLVPSNFDFTSDTDYNAEVHNSEEALSHNIPIERGIAKGSSYYSAGLVLVGITGGIQMEWGLELSRLALWLRLGATLGLYGLNYWISGSWDSPGKRASVGATMKADMQGITLTLNLRYVGQYLSLPIFLSPSNEPAVALYTCVVPAVVGILGYHFIYQPGQARKRVTYLRKLQEERHNSDEAREANKVVERIIKESSRRHRQTEKAIDGLLIEKATYGCAVDDDEARDLAIDVTAALQNLVHRSQLYIPGQQTKIGLQGFYDPAPHLPKVVRIEYTFRGRRHYAEIRDSQPIVLPLSDHLAE